MKNHDYTNMKNKLNIPIFIKKSLVHNTTYNNLMNFNQTLYYNMPSTSCGLSCEDYKAWASCTSLIYLL